MIFNPKICSNSLFHEVLGVDALSGVCKHIEFTMPEKRFFLGKSVLFEKGIKNFPANVPTNS